VPSHSVGLPRLPGHADPTDQVGILLVNAPLLDPPSVTTNTFVKPEQRPILLLAKERGKLTPRLCREKKGNTKGSLVGHPLKVGSGAVDRSSSRQANNGGHKRPHGVVVRQREGCAQDVLGNRGHQR
jgi:hypothetical protein